MKIALLCVHFETSKYRACHLHKYKVPHILLGRTTTLIYLYNYLNALCCSYFNQTLLLITNANPKGKPMYNL